MLLQHFQAKRVYFRLKKNFPAKSIGSQIKTANAGE